MPVKTPPPRPFLKWVGGKRQLLPKLLEAVDAAGAYKHFHEPFLGGGALFFAMAREGRLKAGAYLSDVNKNLIDAYLGVRDNVEAVIRLLSAHAKHHDEAYFYTVRAQSPRKLPQQAARIIYLNKTCYNGLYRENSKGQFNVPFGRYKNPRICDAENLRTVARILGDAHIAADGFSSVLKVARRGDLVYFDPPYHPVSDTAFFTSYAKDGFGVESQEELARTFATLAERGVKVMLSNSMTDFTRSLYKDFYITRVMASRMVNSRADKRGKVAEVLVTSFPVPAQRGAAQTAVTRTTPSTPHRARPIPKNGRAVTAVAARRTAGLLPNRWLLENEYPDVAALIDEVTQEWKAEGKQTRRNWWEVLAGDPKGNPRVVAGRQFPVLRAAQLRQGIPVTDNAICRNPTEPLPARRAPRSPRQGG